MTFRLWRCLILKSVQPKEAYNTPLLSGPIPALVLCNQLTMDEADCIIKENCVLGILSTSGKNVLGRRGCCVDREFSEPHADVNVQ